MAKLLKLSDRPQRQLSDLQPQPGRQHQLWQELWSEIRDLQEQERQQQRKQRVVKRQVEDERLLTRFQELTQLYSASPHYTNPEFIQQYAKKEQKELLRQRDAILQDFLNFHRDHQLISYLTVRAPHLISFRTWKAQALSQAEQLDALSPAPSTKKLTPEERQQKFRFYRERMLERERVHAQDESARTLQKVKLFQQFQHDLSQSDLDPDERQQLEQEFSQKLFQEQPDDCTCRRPTRRRTL